MENFIYSQGNVELQQGHRKQRTQRQFIDFSPQVFATHKTEAFEVSKWDNDNKL